MKSELAVTGMQGLGDNIYQYPVIQKLSEDHTVFLQTPWPQLYPGVPGIRFLPVETRLRTQAKNAARSKDYYLKGYRPQHVIRMSYVAGQHRGMPLYRALCESVGLGAWADKYFLKLRNKSSLRSNYAVIRPATIRKEWPAPARNPDPASIQYVIDILKYKYNIPSILVADINPPHEVWDGAPLVNCQNFCEGQYSIDALMTLVQNARLVVGGVGFLVPMAIALGTPAVILHGGAGGWNHPNHINAPGEGTCYHVLPRRYCLCRDNRHTECDKTILPETIDLALCKALANP